MPTQIEKEAEAETETKAEIEADRVSPEIKRQDTEYDTWLEKFVHYLPALSPTLYGRHD